MHLTLDLTLNLDSRTPTGLTPTGVLSQRDSFASLDELRPLSPVGKVPASPNGAVPHEWAHFKPLSSKEKSLLRGTNLSMTPTPIFIRNPSLYSQACSELEPLRLL